MEEMLAAAQKAAETIQSQMNEMQAKLDSIEVEGQSGGGLVKSSQERTKFNWRQIGELFSYRQIWAICIGKFAHTQIDVLNITAYRC